MNGVKSIKWTNLELLLRDGVVADDIESAHLLVETNRDEHRSIRHHPYIDLKNAMHEMN